MTVNEQLDVVMQEMIKRHGQMTGEAKRWMTIAIENLEEAQTRYNGAIYHDRGTFNRPDPDKIPGQTTVEEMLDG